MRTNAFDEGAEALVASVLGQELVGAEPGARVAGRVVALLSRFVQLSGLGQLLHLRLLRPGDRGDGGVGLGVALAGQGGGCCQDDLGVLVGEAAAIAYPGEGVGCGGEADQSKGNRPGNLMESSETWDTGVVSPDW